MKKLFIFLALICLVSIAQAQWQQTSLDSGYIYSFAIKGDTIFAGSDGNGVYLSTNNGSSWTAVNNGLTGNALDVQALAISGNNIFAGTTYSGVYLSSNNGSSWTATGLINVGVYCFAVSGGNIFVGTNNGYSGGVYLSSNNGSSWTQVSTGLAVDDKALVIKGDTIFAGTCGGVYLSSNNGSSWFQSGLYGCVQVLAISGNNIFAGTSYNGVYLSSNNGSSWTAVDTNSEFYSLAISGNNIFAGTYGYDGGVYLSSNNGSSWTQAGTGLPSDKVSSLIISGNTIFAGTDDSGVWKTSLTGLGVEEINNNASNIAVYPNPATNNLTIESPLNTLIEISNVQGQIIKTISTNSNKTTIDISTFSKGVYIVKEKTDNGIEFNKFVKE